MSFSLLENRVENELINSSSELKNSKNELINSKNELILK